MTTSQRRAIAQSQSPSSNVVDASSVRSQAAFVRALIDELERISPAGAEVALSAQLAEELARLGCRCLEAARALAAQEDAVAAASGVALCA